MRFSLLTYGKHFGQMTKTYGQYRFTLSPNEQAPMKGFFDQAIVRVFRMYVWRNWLYYAPPATFAYLTYDWAKKANYLANRKDPQEFENDE